MEHASLNHVHTSSGMAPSSSTPWQTILERLDVAAAQSSARYVFIGPNAEAEAELSFHELVTKARIVAARLQRAGYTGQRIALLDDTGPEFLIALFGCLYAGCCVAPLAVARTSRALERLRTIVDDLAPAAMITNRKTRTLITETDGKLGFLRRFPCHQVNELLDQEDWLLSLPHPLTEKSSTVAVIQYTSGSTSVPKGVCITHANIMANCALIDQMMQTRPSDSIVTWAPLFHDMGLVGGVFYPAYATIASFLIRPDLFIIKPSIWLKVLSRYKGTLSHSPCFGYEVCADRCVDEELEGLDLSVWRVACVGAEPIHLSTLDRFTTRFAPYGFRRRVFAPCYALAEATLLVSGGADKGPIIVTSPSSSSANNNNAASAGTNLAVASGRVIGKQLVKIVDPQTGEEQHENQVGEIWVSGDSVAQGYLHQPNASAFSGRLAEYPDLHFLRTGDLGFFADNELVITGRLKELVIIRGENHYPDDLEVTARSAHQALRSCQSAAFGAKREAREQLFLVQECPRAAVKEASSILEAIVATLSEAHGLTPSEVLLVPRGSLPRTSSGKIQRLTVKADFEGQRLEALAIWPQRLSVSPECGASTPTMPKNGSEAVVIQVIRDVLRIAELDSDVSLFDLGVGLDSLSATRLKHELVKRTQIDLPLAAFFKTPTVQGIAQVIDDALQGTQVPVEDATAPIALRDALPATFALSPIQEAYWVGRAPTMPLGGVGTHAYRELEIAHLDVNRLKAAIDILIQRHDALRARINSEGRLVFEDCIRAPEITEYDLRDQPEALDSHLTYVRDLLSHKLYSGLECPLFEFQVTHVDHEVSHLHISFDLMSCDVWSGSIFSEELVALYQSPGLRLPLLGLDFAAYLSAAETPEQRDQKSLSQNYWLKQIGTLKGGPELPTRIPATELIAPKFARIESSLNASGWERVKKRARKHGVTANAVLLCALGLVVQRWSQASAFSIVITASHRRPSHPDVGLIMGEFSTTLLLQLAPEPRSTFSSQVRKVQERLWTDLEHIEFSGVEITREMRRLRGSEATKGATVVFTSTLTGPGQFSVDALDRLGRTVYAISQTPQVSLDFQVHEVDGELRYNWDYPDALFEKFVIGDLFKTYRAMIEELASEVDEWEIPAQDLTALNIAGAGSAFGILSEPPAHGLIHEAFEAQALQDPEAIALQWRDGSLTYAQVRGRALATAAALIDHGLSPEEPVAILIPRGWRQVIAALGTAYAGGAFVPLSPDWPETRIRTILKRANVRIVLVESYGIPHTIAGLNLTSLPVPTYELTQVPARPPSPSGPAYIIYTSGSTGEPKGVIISHRSAKNTLDDVSRRFGVGRNDRALAVSSLTFDLSVFDIFGLLGAGGTLVLLEPSGERDPDTWCTIAATFGITIWNSAPALMDLLVERPRASKALGALRLCLLSGDWIPTSLPARVLTFAPTARVVSLGGATEAAIWSIFHEIRPGESFLTSVPYGQPLSGQTVQVLDDFGQLRPCGVPGELYIGGRGLAEGYLGETAITAERFLIHPRTGVRLYRTGDWGHYLQTGEIQFLGRLDDQVKINGHRIELGEVEAVLAGAPYVTAAAVAVVVQGAAGRRLCGFITPERDACGLQAVMDYARMQLPAFARPHRLIALDRLPLTDNGKIDRNALLRLIDDAPSPPSRPIEQASPRLNGDLLYRFSAIVGNFAGQAAPMDKSLLELGLDSVGIVKLSTELQREFGIEIALRDLFEAQTIQEIYERVLRTSAQGEATAPSDTILTSLEDRARVKEAWRMRRQILTGSAHRRLPRPAVELSSAVRRSVRTYGSLPVSAEEISNLLQPFSETGGPASEHAYGSAGDVYPVTTSLFLKPGRAHGIRSGLYSYLPTTHGLCFVAEMTADEIVVASSEADIVEQAAFLIFLTAHMTPMRALYGSEALKYSTLEAGAMAQLIETAALASELGVCQIRDIYNPKLLARLGLEDSVLLATLAAGPLLDRHPIGVSPQTTIVEGEI